ncbi:MAG: hypothetical protein CVU43_22135 [Chloroflexi bacterium HGW-Chloroflexi-5]|nr:MAG: hypothetical protein CVU87_09440 [Firmicutes bacterium HGW-Firmicutes-12]PKN96162.1 MAG: hypothetical protein CVU43_22135 [Chloroflexi bacterium HGW-Chloroflexi-5]
MAKSTDSINITAATEFIDEISFSLKHLNFGNWGLDKLKSHRNEKDFNNFLRRYSGKSVKYFQSTVQPCKDDKQDTFEGQHVHHYKINEKFRIHGFFLGNRFKIIRIDPNHEFHK